MLTLRDCLDFYGLTSDQLEGVGDNEKMARVVAAEWANLMLRVGEGGSIIREALENEIEEAQAHHLDDWEMKCRNCLYDFDATVH